MSYIIYGRKMLRFEGGRRIIEKMPALSSADALSRMQTFWTAVNMYMVEWDALPSNQTELSAYMSFAPADYYTFTYTGVDSSIGYFNAISGTDLAYSFTRTVAWYLGSLTEIICQKLGTLPPGQADYVSQVLSCQIGTYEV